MLFFGIFLIQQIVFRNERENMRRPNYEGRAELCEIRVLVADGH